MRRGLWDRDEFAGSAVSQQADPADRAAGSTADIVSRFDGQELAKALGQPVVIENKPAAGGTVAMGDVARAAPDGYTIGFAPQGILVFNQAIYGKPGYDSVKDFRPVAFVGGVSNVMVVPPTSAAKSPADVIAAAKARPGGLTFSSGGAGTSHHLSGVLFARSTATELLHVPYKGAPQGILAVMSGEVAMGFFNTPTVIGQIKDGKLKALGVTSLTRSPLLPGVPTLDEQGVKGYEVKHLVRLRRAGGHAQRHRRAAAPGVHAHLHRCRGQGKARAAGLRPGRAERAGGVRQNHQRRSDPMGTYRQGVGGDGRLMLRLDSPRASIKRP